MEETTGGKPSVCGDGELGGFEQCDDGDLDDFDGCSAACRDEYEATSVLAVGSLSCASFSDQSLRCWGGDIQGSNGSESTNTIGDEPGEMAGALEPVELGASFPVWELRAAPCARSEDSVKCWGFGPSLGLGDTENRGDEPGEMGDALPALDLNDDVLLLGDHCARLPGGLKCWGGNAWGGLGLGDTEDRGDEPGEMGNALPFTDLGTFGTVLDQCSGSGYRCAMSDLGVLKCWGYNYAGVLGAGGGGDLGDEPDEMGDNLAAVDLGSDTFVVRIACGVDTACALLDDGALKCWGDSEWGELVDVTGTSFGGSWGGMPGQMGDDLPEIVADPERTISDVKIGYDVICVRFEDGAVKCWGHNFAGSLGLGHDDALLISSVAEVPVIDLGTDEHALQISVGISHACALLENGRVKCWGHNHVGQLGYEDTENRGDAPGEMGDALPYIRFF